MRRPLRSIRLLALSSHPGPTATVTVLAAGLAAALGFAPGRVAAVAVAVLLGQLSIGLSNDWIDAGRDRRVGRTDKPVARGEVTVAEVRAAALGTAAACLAVSALLGPAFLVAHVVLVGAGWAYNAGLKRTAASVVPFVVAFGILPTVVALGGPDPLPAAAWAVATGAVLGVSIHFTNVLPDLEDDARTGVRGLPHRLGRVPSGLVAFGALALGAVVASVGPVLADPAHAVTPLAVAGLVAMLAIAAWGAVLVVTRPPGRLLFRLIMAASLLLVALVAANATQLT
ncbi:MULTISPECIES: UbiA family prenyltransferase [Clavibacter]|uniref:UbiA family prenyltransferase n=1 Tax=Clavibacter TaxID=1573 RepID=UPI000A860EF7|nr:UbiA family prenyltransferase [Clavibacter michiganensis]